MIARDTVSLSPDLMAFTICSILGEGSRELPLDSAAVALDLLEPNNETSGRDNDGAHERHIGRDIVILLLNKPNIHKNRRNEIQ